MKNLFKLFVAGAAVLAATLSCTKEQNFQTENTTEQVSISFTADSQLAEYGSKTHLAGDTENTVLWDETGEKLRVFEDASGTVSTAATADEYIIDANQALFSASFDASEATSFRYSALYPESAWITSNNKDLAALKFTTAAVQTPSLTSFDPKADRLIAKFTEPKATQADGETLLLQFKRMVALGKMTITGISSEDPIVSVTISATGKTLAGSSKVNIATGVVFDYGYDNKSASIELKYDKALNFTNNSVAYFTCLPSTIAVGESFTVTVVTESAVGSDGSSTKTTFTKNAEVKEKDLVFAEGKSSAFTMNFNGIVGTEETVVDYSGTYAIVAQNKDGDYWVLKNEKNDTRYATEEITSLESVEYTTREDITWQITKLENGKYSIKGNNNKYLNWNSGNTGDISDEYIELNIDKFDVTYQIHFLDGADTRYLSRNANSTNKYWAFYKSGQTKDLYLIRAGEDTRTVLAPVTELKAVLAENANNTVVLTWTGSENADRYIITYGEESKTVTECAATIEGLDFDWDYTFSVVAKNSDETKYKDSPAVSVEQTTGTAPALTWPEGATFTAAVLDETKPKEVTLTWVATENATAYTISWGSESTTVEAPATSTTLTCAAYETEYTFSIVAENPAYKPTEAKTATATTKAIYAAKISVADFNLQEDSNDVWYELTGTVSAISGTNYNLTDGTGTVYVYNHKGFYNLGVKEGDTVTIKGNKDTYNNKIEVINAVLVSHTPLPRAEFAKTSASFAAENPVAENLVITYSSSVAVENVTFEFEGTNADKFTASKTAEGVSFCPVGNNSTDAAYTATLNVMFNGNVIGSIEVSQAQAGGSADITIIQSSFTTISGNLAEDPNITYALYKGTGTTVATKPYNNGLRVYQGGGYITIAALNGHKITQIKITTTSVYETTTVAYSVDNGTQSSSTNINKNSSYTISSISGASVNIYCVATDSKKRLEIASIEVTYE